MARYAHAIYCDDSRQEVGNKLSLIGMYQSTMYVPSFPIVIPKLSIVVFARTPAEKPFKTLKVRLLRGDEPILEAQVPEEAFARHQGETRRTSQPGEFPVFDFQTVIQLAGIRLDGPTRFRVRIDTEEEELRAGALLVELAAKEDSSIGVPEAHSTVRS